MSALVGVDIPSAIKGFNDLIATANAARGVGPQLADHVRTAALRARCAAVPIARRHSSGVTRAQPRHRGGDEFCRTFGIGRRIAAAERDAQGRLLTCEHQSRRITRTEYNGAITVLAVASSATVLQRIVHVRRQLLA